MNYQLVLDETLKNLNGVPKLLLHACCAPCSSYCIEYLSNYFEITIFYYNPNIDTLDEFNYRFNELDRFIKELKPYLYYITKTKYSNSLYRELSARFSFVINYSSDEESERDIVYKVLGRTIDCCRGCPYKIKMKDKRK